MNIKSFVHIDEHERDSNMLHLVKSFHTLPSRECVYFGYGGHKWLVKHK